MLWFCVPQATVTCISTNWAFVADKSENSHWSKEKRRLDLHIFTSSFFFFKVWVSLLVDDSWSAKSNLAEKSKKNPTLCFSFQNMWQEGNVRVAGGEKNSSSLAGILYRSLSFFLPAEDWGGQPGKYRLIT